MKVVIATKLTEEAIEYRFDDKSYLVAYRRGGEEHTRSTYMPTSPLYDQQREAIAEHNRRVPTAEPSSGHGTYAFRAGGDVNFYTIYDEVHGKWLARIQINGEVHINRQVDIMQRLVDEVNRRD